MPDNGPQPGYVRSDTHLRNPNGVTSFRSGDGAEGGDGVSGSYVRPSQPVKAAKTSLYPLKGAAMGVS
jgi:hypothetical protein